MQIQDVMAQVPADLGSEIIAAAERTLTAEDFLQRGLAQREEDALRVANAIMLRERAIQAATALHDRGEDDAATALLRIAESADREISSIFSRQDDLPF